jgi:hypothetical protein
MGVAVWAVGWPAGYGRAALTGFTAGDLGAVFGFFTSQGYVDPGRKFPAFAFALDMAYLVVLLVFSGSGGVTSIDEHTNAILVGAGLGAVGFLGRLLALSWRAIVYHVYGRLLPPLYKDHDEEEPPLA